MQELVEAMLRFSAAMTLFGVQQLQNAVGAAADTQSALNKFRDALNKMSDAISSQMDDSKQETLKSMTKVQNDLVERTWDAMNINMLDPREMMDTMTDLTKKTTDSMADLVKKATATGSKSSEPQSAANTLGR